MYSWADYIFGSQPKNSMRQSGWSAIGEIHSGIERSITWSWLPVQSSWMFVILAPPAPALIYQCSSGNCRFTCICGEAGDQFRLAGFVKRKPELGGAVKVILDTELNANTRNNSKTSSYTIFELSLSPPKRAKQWYSCYPKLAIIIPQGAMSRPLRFWRHSASSFVPNPDVEQSNRLSINAWLQQTWYKAKTSCIVPQ